MIDMYEICQRLIAHEGLRLQPYFCSKKKLTIGVGRCLETNPLTAEEIKDVDGKYFWEWVGRINKLRQQLELCKKKEL